MEVAERARADVRMADAPRRDADRAVTVPPRQADGTRDTRMVLNLFFEEKDNRWFTGDRHLRTLARRLLLGKPWINGQQRVFLNLCAGLDRLGIRYRVNDYRYIRNHPEELACVIGRPFVLDWIDWKNPILFGVAGFDHPLDAPDLLTRYPVKHVVVPCKWYADMCRPGWPNIDAWPVGIDTDSWTPSTRVEKSVDVLLYDKLLWDRDHFAPALLEPIRARLEAEGVSFEELRYGSYKEDEYRAALARCRSMIFLSQNESQGIACLQAMSSGVPVLAWDRGGPWRDPKYYPHRVNFESVSSVPYWDDRCGMKFTDASAFNSAWPDFWTHVTAGDFNPRQYVVDNLTLETQALHYYRIAESVMQRQLAR